MSPLLYFLGDDLIDADVPCLRQLLDIYEEHNAAVLAVQEVPVQEVSRYGIVEPLPGDDSSVCDSRCFQVKDMVENRMLKMRHLISL